MAESPEVIDSKFGLGSNLYLRLWLFCETHHTFFLKKKWNRRRKKEVITPLDTPNDQVEDMIQKSLNGKPSVSSAPRQYVAWNSFFLDFRSSNLFGHGTFSGEINISAWSTKLQFHPSVLWRCFFCYQKKTWRWMSNTKIRQHTLTLDHVTVGSTV